MSIEQLQEHLITRLNGDLSDLVIFEKGTDSTLFVEFTDYVMRNHKKLDSITLDDALTKLQLKPDSETRKLLITSLGFITDVRAYRTLEKIVNDETDELASWAIFAFQQSRALIEDSLSDKSRYYVFSGLGGKGDKLRYFAVIHGKENAEISGFQQERLIKELEYESVDKEAIIESVQTYPDFISFVFLLSMKYIAFEFMDNIINNVNEIGGNLSEDCILATDKLYNEDEIRKIIKGEINPNDEFELDDEDLDDLMSYLD